MEAPAAPPGESRVLYRIISTVGSSLELEEVLGAVVRLLSDASGVHACFVYLLDGRGDALVLRAASEPYAHLLGQIRLERGEGLAWWAAERREPAFIRDNALADPRNKYVPELDEERFQSLVSVPIHGRSGSVIGAITLHTAAPREFTKAEVEFLVSSASLVAGAIENARLYEETRRRLAELEHLIELGETIARAETLAELLPAVTSRSVQLLRAERCHLYLLDPGTEELRLRASTPPGSAARETIGLSELGAELRRGRRSRVAAPLVASEELVGLLVADGTSEAELARAVANQAAVAIKKIELIDRLTEKNLIKDFFEELVRGALPGELDVRAARLGCDLDEPHLVVVAAPPSDALERALGTVARGSLFDRRDDSVRALLPIASGREADLLERLRRAHAQLGEPVAIGVSNPCQGAASFAAGFEEAWHALVGTSVLQAQPAVMAYEELGPYKYLLRMSLDAGTRDTHRDAIRRLAEYDRQRSTFLLRTLEEFLRRRGSIGATAAALYVHPNTLRQRLRRIQDLSGLDLRREDWLMVEIALKLVRLEAAMEHTSARAPMEDADIGGRGGGR
jgi:GAF domain-containing protein